MADNILNKIRNKILGNKIDVEDFATNKALDTLNLYKNKDSRLGYLELIRSVVSKAEINNTEFKSLNFGGINSAGGPELFGQKRRLSRYSLFESIKTYIPFCNRALNVLVDNILSPDDLTKISLIVSGEDSVNEKEQYEIKKLIDTIKLEKYLNQIIKNTLLFGDYFVEITTTRNALLNKIMLTENQEDYYILKETFKIRNENRRIEKKEISFALDFRTSNEDISELFLNEDDSKNIKTDKENEINKEDLSLVLHNPSRVVKLQTELYPVCMGYLVFPIYTQNRRLSFEQEELNQFCNKITEKVRKSLMLNNDLDEKTKDDIKNVIRNVAGLSGRDLFYVRYVPPDMMQHFILPSDKYLPYGESVFDSVAFSAKVLIALESALAIQRINKSTERLKIGVEIGMSRDAAKMVQALQEELEKKKISLDDYATIDSIPSSISTFENIYVPQRDGKEFVSINTFNEGNVDIRSKIEDLKFLRDQIVSATMVPPSFIGIEENLCVSLSTRIHLINGTTKTLEELIIMYENGEKIPDVYSCDKDGNIVPGKITWAGKTRLNTQLIRVWLDNGKYVDTTLDHPFMLRDGTYKEAQYLEECDSLMPFYTRTANYLKSKRGSYQQVYFPGSNTWILIYQAFANYWKIYPDNENKYNIHHINMNPLALHDRLKNVFSEEELGSILSKNKPSYKVANRLNHKVVKTELLEGLYDTGDIRIEEYHNFATESGVFVHNSNKNALTQENILFARTVINYQKIFSESFTSLVHKIIKIIDPENYFNYLDCGIGFQPPKNLQFETESRNINDIVSMINSLKELGIPVEYLKKKYLITMDWEEINKITLNQNVDDHFKPQKSSEEQGF